MLAGNILLRRSADQEDNSLEFPARFAIFPLHSLGLDLDAEYARSFRPSERRSWVPSCNYDAYEATGGGNRLTGKGYCCRQHLAS
jgi:hypothetical protein